VEFEKIKNLAKAVWHDPEIFFRWNPVPKWIAAGWRLQARLSLSVRFAIGFGVLALVMLGAFFVAHGWWAEWAGFAGEGCEAFARYLEREGHTLYGQHLSWVAAGAALLCAASAGLAFVRKPFAFRTMQAAWALSFVVGALVFRWTIRAADIINLADNKAFGSLARNDVWAWSFIDGFFVLVWALVLLVALVAVAARRAYGLSGMPAPFRRDVGGDLVEDVKRGGSNPRWRSSIRWAYSIFLVMLIVPYLLIWWGWEEPYGLPQGQGEMVQQQQVKIKKEKKKKKKKLTINPFSPYILERMDIDDVKTLEELEEESRDTYVATSSQALGKGGKGKGGWPEGMENAKVRFIRLEYRGGDWNQDMGKGADYNLLIKFHEWTGFKIAKETEHRPIERLKYFPKKKSPPFVFLTGMGGMSVSEKEVKILREYCLAEGGMLFIDNGGGHFGSAVRSLLARVFPGKALVDIPNDDPIYQMPYVFPDGAPPFWHHDGYRPMGIRDEGRWVVFYHPGDVNDAWKDDHSGASAEVADQAYKLGVNVMFYAFNQYYRRHYEQ